MREQLTPESRLELGNKSYVIDKVIGEGANCIVYDAHLSERGAGRKVRIKELIPACLESTREGAKIVWNSKEDREREILRFKDTYKTHINFQNDPELGNTIAHIVDDLMENNNTLYMVVDVDYGSTPDRAGDISLLKYVQIIKNLAAVIERYHRRGYLHLDIKPGNFLVLPDINDTVKLIDIDSVLSLESIRKKEVRTLAGSPGYSAPELEQKKIARLGPHTDIYSICAILFEHIFKRRPGIDDIGSFKKWNLKEAVEDKLVPSALKKLEEILIKGLKPSPQKRYSSVRELSEDLTELLILMKRDSYIKNSYFTTSGDVHFVGRDKELDELHDLLKDNRAVFLWGFGGNGKTTLAQRYIELFHDEYEAVVMFRYRDSLDDFIESVPIVNLKDESGQSRNESLGYKLRRIKELSSEKTLFIIDNFDTAEDYRLEDILAIEGRFIFTTRVREQNLYQENIQFLRVGPLRRQECIGLLLNDKAKVTQEEYDAAAQIVELYEGHTMLLSLVGKYIIKSGSTIEEVKTRLCGQGIKGLGEETDNIQYRKDGGNRKNNVLGHLKDLFSVMNISEKNIEAIEAIYYLTRFIGPYSVTRSAYKEYTGAKNCNVPDELVELNIVSENKGSGSDFLRIPTAFSDIEDALPFGPSEPANIEDDLPFGPSATVNTEDDLPFGPSATVNTEDALPFGPSEPANIEDDLPFGPSEPVYVLHPLIVQLCLSLSRKKEDSTVYKNAVFHLQNRILHQDKTIHEIRKYFRLYFSFLRPDEENKKAAVNVSSREVQLIIPLMTAMKEDNFYKNLIGHEEYREFAYTRYDPLDIQVAEGLLKAINEETEIPYRGGMIPWWYGKIIAAVCLFKMGSSKRSSRETVINSLTEANRGILCHIKNTKREILSEFDIKEIAALIGSESDITDQCILYSGKRIYNAQRSILNYCNMPYIENSGKLINIRKDHRIGAIPYFKSLYDITEVMKNSFGGECSDKIRRLSESIVWNLRYMQGSFEDPFKLKDIALPEGRYLYIEDKKEWEKSYTASFIEYAENSGERAWLSGLVFDDVFLTEQPRLLLRALIGRKLTEELCAVNVNTKGAVSGSGNDILTSSNRFMSLFRKNYKGKDFAGRYKEIIEIYMVQYGLYRDSIQRIPQNDIATWRKKLWNQIVFGSARGKEKDVEEKLRALFSRENNGYIEEFIGTVKYLKNFAYKNEAELVSRLLLECYKVDPENKDWMLQVRNAVALSRIAPYWGKNSLRKQYIEFAASKLSLEACIGYMDHAPLDKRAKLWAANIAFKEVNETLADYLYKKTKKEGEKSKKPQRITDLMISTELPKSKKIRNICMQCQEIIDRLSKEYAPREYKREEEIYMISEGLKVFDSNSYSNSNSCSDSYGPFGEDENPPEDIFGADITFGDKNADDNNYHRIALKWYKKRKCYDTDKNYTGEKYLFYIYRLCDPGTTEYVLFYGENIRE